MGWPGGTDSRDIEYSGKPYGDHLKVVQHWVNDAKLLIGVNLKYDLHWLRRYGIILPKDLKIWDCQIAHFLLVAQRKKYPSQDDICEYLGLPIKPSKVHQYWENGVDSDQIPKEDWEDYLAHDGRTPIDIYEKQVLLIKEKGLLPLMRLCCDDLLVLEEMEWNGLKYDIQKSREKEKECEERYKAVEQRLSEITRGAGINWESPDQVSSVLYGGTIDCISKEICGVYKTGAKSGQDKYRKVVTTKLFPQLVKPLKGSALKKDGKWSTSEETLVSLNAKGKAKQIIELVLEGSRLSKLKGTYYGGLPDKFEEFGWENSIIHHSLNQCVAVTGRLSSSNPNGQNIDEECKECFITRYDN